jgi:small subunit ribosomal protein S21
MLVFVWYKTIKVMLIIEVKDSESVDRALKNYKRKVQRTKLIKEVRQRKHFVKPSIDRREEILKATYIQIKDEREAE